MTGNFRKCKAIRDRKRTAIAISNALYSKVNAFLSLILTFILILMEVYNPVQWYQLVRAHKVCCRLLK